MNFLKVLVIALVMACSNTLYSMQGQADCAGHKLIILNYLSKHTLNARDVVDHMRQLDKVSHLDAKTFLEELQNFLHLHAMSLFDIKGKHNKTIMHIAAQQNYGRIVELIGEVVGDEEMKKACKIRDGFGKTPFHYAVLGILDTTAAEKIIELVQDVNDTTIFSIADKDGKTALHRVLLAKLYDQIIQAAGAEAGNLQAMQDNSGNVASRPISIF